MLSAIQLEYRPLDAGRRDVGFQTPLAAAAADAAGVADRNVPQLTGGSGISVEVELVGVGIGAPNGNYYRGTIEKAPNLRRLLLFSLDALLLNYFNLVAFSNIGKKRPVWHPTHKKHLFRRPPRKIPGAGEDRTCFPMRIFGPMAARIA